MSDFPLKKELIQKNKKQKKKTKTLLTGLCGLASLKCARLSHRLETQEIADVVVFLFESSLEAEFFLPLEDLSLFPQDLTEWMRPATLGKKVTCFIQVY